MESKIPMLINGKEKMQKVTYKTESYTVSNSNCPADYYINEVIYKNKTFIKDISNNYRNCVPCPDSPKEFCSFLIGSLQVFYPESIKKSFSFSGPAHQLDIYKPFDDGSMALQLNLSITPVKFLRVVKFNNKKSNPNGCAHREKVIQLYYDQIDCKNFTKGTTYTIHGATFETPYRTKAVSATFHKVIKDENLVKTIEQIIKAYQNISTDIDIINGEAFKKKIKLINNQVSKKKFNVAQ
tara:strand:+ start:1376 stop:2092 length:717 start_codon:yes stop_codon:yes gene_type:complete